MVVVLLFSTIFFVSKRKPSTKIVNPSINLVDYADTGSTVVYTQYGPLISEEQRVGIRISVSRDQRKLEILQGYNEKVVKEQTLTNNQAAYDEFIHALKIAGYDKSKKAKYSDNRGVCPLGDKFTYKLMDNSKELLSLWSTSCGKGDGNFGGESTLIKTLFEKQIPKFDTITEQVTL